MSRITFDILKAPTYLIICEYNPFHAGHAYHIKTARQLSGADYLVAIMSGSFVQRGEPAVFDKWSRAKAAIEGGVDLVLELPCLYSLSSAERFAMGGVQILSELNAVSFLSFGMEDVHPDLFVSLSQILVEEPSDYQALLKAGLAKGKSFAAARADALCALVPELDPALLSRSNNILALEYYKALCRLGAKIQALPIQRKGASYLDPALTPLPSALALRSALKRGETLSFLSSVFSGKIPVFPEALFPTLLYRLRSMSLSELASLCEVKEGFEYRLQSACQTAKTYSELLELLRSRRYPTTRVNRILMYALLHITKEAVALCTHKNHYARVLAVKQGAAPLLSYLARSASIPVVVKPKELEENPLFFYDRLSTDIYGVFSGLPSGLDYSIRFRPL